MSKTLRWLALGLCLIGAAIPAALVSAAETAPKDFLAALYANYTGKGKGIDSTSPATIKRYLTPELGALLLKSQKVTKAGDAPDLDSDPYIDAQDWQITGLSITVAEKGADQATGTVSFKNFNDVKTIILDLKKTNAGWRIDDIHWPGDEGTLRQLLSGK